MISTKSLAFWLRLKCHVLACLKDWCHCMRIATHPSWCLHGCTKWMDASKSNSAWTHVGQLWVHTNINKNSFCSFPRVLTFLRHLWLSCWNCFLISISLSISLPPSIPLPPSLSNTHIHTFFPPGPPGPPGVVIVEEITDTTATLSWTRGLDNQSPISTYNLQARSPFSLGWQTVKTGNQ